jgi:hypothetical protein
LGIEQHVHSIVIQVDASGLSVRIPDGSVTRYEAGTVLWTAGVTTPSVATAIAKATGATQDRAERIEVGPDRSIPAPRNPRHRRRDLRRERTFTVKGGGSARRLRGIDHCAHLHHNRSRRSLTFRHAIMCFL